MEDKSESLNQNANAPKQPIEPQEKENLDPNREIWTLLEKTLSEILLKNDAPDAGGSFFAFQCWPLYWRF